MSNKKIRIILANEDLVNYARKTPATDEEVISAQQDLLSLKSTINKNKKLSKNKIIKLKKFLLSNFKI